VKKLLIITLLSWYFAGCNQKRELSSINQINWNKRTVEQLSNDTLVKGQTYLPIYSQIYSQTEHKTHDLTVTISMRNINLHDTIFINKATYYNTHGALIRTYFTKTIFIAPMETVEIVIDEIDQEGGTGANFLFDWQINPVSNEPLFEGVMISTSGQQGLSFTTRGIKLLDHLP